MTCQRGTSSTKTVQDGTSSTKTVPDGTSSTKTVQDGTSSTKTDLELQEGAYSTKTDEDQAPKLIKGSKNGVYSYRKVSTGDRCFRCCQRRRTHKKKEHLSILRFTR